MSVIPYIIFKFIGATVYEIAGGSGRPPSYKVWVPKGLVQEGFMTCFYLLIVVTAVI